MFACIRTPRAPDRAVAIARAFSPRLQRYGADGVVCDVSGLGRLLGEPPGIGAELWRACGSDSRDASVAIAATQIAARLLAHANAALTVIEGRPAGALAPLPLAVLRSLVVPQAIVGTTEQASEDAFEVFDRWGLRTLGDLAALPADALSARLGQTGVVLRAHAVGVDAGPLVPAVDVPRFFERSAGTIVLRSHVFTAMGNVMVAVPRSVTGYSLRPFVSGGAGLMHVGISDVLEIVAVDTNLFGLNVGGGAVGPLSNVLDVRFDLRWFKSVTSGGERPLRPGAPLAFWRFAVGLSIR